MFANATKAGETHVVSLETSWGASKLHPDDVVSRDCDAGGYEPGARLCRYLLQNSAAEFADLNFHAAFACISGIPQDGANPISYERIDVRVGGYGAAGVRENVKVWLDFKPNADHGTMQLLIGATGEADRQ